MYTTQLTTVLICSQKSMSLPVCKKECTSAKVSLAVRTIDKTKVEKVQGVILPTHLGQDAAENGGRKTLCVPMPINCTENSTVCVPNQHTRRISALLEYSGTVEKEGKRRDFWNTDTTPEEQSSRFTFDTGNSLR